MMWMWLYERTNMKFLLILVTINGSMFSGGEFYKKEECLNYGKTLMSLHKYVTKTSISDSNTISNYYCQEI